MILAALLLTTMLLPANPENMDSVYFVYPSHQRYYYAEKAYFESKVSITDSNEEDTYFAQKQQPQTQRLFTKEEILFMLKPKENTMPESVVFTTVFFDFDSYILKKTEKQKLLKILPDLKKSNTVEIKVDGYTDKVGTKEYNDKLAVKRAMAVRKFLVAQGVRAEKIKISGQGKCCYISDKDRENRRVEVRAR